MSLTDKTKRWLKKNCNISLKGKTILVTGANSGVGFKTAEISAYLGGDVILACRSTERAKEARLKLISDNPEASISVMQLDLARHQFNDNSYYLADGRPWKWCRDGGGHFTIEI